MSEKICMIMEWEKRGNCWMNICSPDFVREQKYTMLSNRENLTLDGRKALKKLLVRTKGSILPALLNPKNAV